MRYTEPREVEFDDYYDHDSGEYVTGFVTEKVDTNSTFGQAVLHLVLASHLDRYGYPEILMTTRAHWSGYSEFTITNTWSEIALTVPAWQWEQEWPSLGDFLRALAEANPEADR